MDSLGTMPTDLYVCTSGSDSNSGLTTSAPFATMQKAWDVAPKIFRTSGTIHVCGGTYNASLQIYGFVGSANKTITMKGYSTAGAFTDTALLTGTATALGSGLYPTTNSTLVDSGAAFGAAGTQKGRFLCLTGGPGFDAVTSENNCYVLEGNSSGTVLLVAGRWRVAIPTTGTTYAIYNPAAFPIIDGQSTREYGVHIFGSSGGIRIHRIHSRSHTKSGFKVENSTLVSTAGKEFYLNSTAANSVGLSAVHPEAGFYFTGSVIQEVSTNISNADDLVGFMVFGWTKISKMYHNVVRGTVRDTAFVLGLTSYIDYFSDNLGFEVTGSTSSICFGVEDGGHVTFFENNRATGCNTGLYIDSRAEVLFSGANRFETSVQSGIVIAQKGHLYGNTAVTNITSVNNGGYGVIYSDGGRCENLCDFTTTGNTRGATIHVGSARMLANNVNLVLAATTTKTTMFTYPVDGGLLAANRSIDIELEGYFVTDATPPATVTMTVEYGTCVATFVSAQALAASKTGSPVTIELRLFWNDGVNGQLLVGKLRDDDILTARDSFMGAAACTINSAANQNLIFTVQFSAIDAGSAFYVYQTLFNEEGSK